VTNSVANAPNLLLRP